MSDEVDTGPVIKNAFYLKFADEAEMQTQLAAFYHDVVIDEDANTTESQLNRHGDGYAIRVIGTMYAPTGNTLTDDEGFDYPEKAAVAGWHVNVKLTNDTHRTAFETLDTNYGVTPATPKHGWL